MIRDAPLDFQGGRKFLEEKKITLAMRMKKKSPPSGGKKKITFTLVSRGKFH